jgi:two-component system response regulator AtoC
MRVALHSPDTQTLIELRRILVGLGHETVDAPGVEAAAGLDVRAVFAEWAMSSVAADLFAGLNAASVRTPAIPIVILLSARSREFAARARAAGAADVLFLPVDPLELEAEIDAIDRRERPFLGDIGERFERLRETTLVGEHPRFKKCIDELAVAARTDANVLLLGETGVGKEMFASAIHEIGDHSRHRYLAINCANLPGSLLESELFGHVKGAFTGADKTRLGRFEEVGEGTLMLDEVGDMEAPLQMKLLRVIEQREFQRLGENKNIPFRGRLICATSVDLDRAVEDGKFRRDLLGRINQLRIVLPPLRERRSDIPLLASRLLKKHANAHVELSESTKQHLLSFTYPMNVRQLENIMVSALAHAGGRSVIIPRDLPSEVLQQPRERARPETIAVAIPASLGYAEARVEALRGVDRIFLRRILEQHSGNQSAAAAELGIDRKTLSQRYREAFEAGGAGSELS